MLHITPTLADLTFFLPILLHKAALRGKLEVVKVLMQQNLIEQIVNKEPRNNVQKVSTVEPLV